jgi:demethylmenaquinone methyltransferase/2-methoxy-6-polyprenyl-1,4-benzoquinol methylase
MSENSYYRTDATRAEKVRELFSKIARRYDRMNDWMSFGLHRRWKRKTSQLCTLAEGQMALDVCCGTGDISRELAGQGARVIGLDFTEPMLSIAQKRSHASTLARSLTFLCGDALHLPFSDATFDAVTIGYGLRNLADFEAGLRELLRVTKSGGRVVVLDFGLPDNRLWRFLYRIWLRVAVPWMGLLMVGDRQAYDYILTSLDQYPAQRGIAHLMEKVGFTSVHYENLLGGVSSIHVAKR